MVDDHTGIGAGPACPLHDAAPVQALRTIGLAALVVMPGCVPFQQRVTGDEIAVSFRTDDPHARFEYFQRHVPGRRGGHDRYGTICTSSCDTVVHDWSRFRISGDGVTDSSDFHLQAGRPVALRARTGPFVANVLGIVIAVLGGDTAGSAAFVAALAPEYRRDATTVALSGLGALAAGVLLWFLTRTTVEADPPGALVQ
jgi:hypothetical protein